MLLTQNFGAECQRPATERLGFGVSALTVETDCKIYQADDRVRMLLASHLGV